MHPVYDEDTYLRQSLGAAECVAAIARGEWPANESWDTWYGGAVYPPLFPLVLSLGTLFPMDTVSAARLVNVILSSVTTALVFLLVYKMTGDRKTSVLAGLIHALYPSFIGFSHLLWTETLFGLVLLLGVLLNFAMFDATTPIRTVAYTLLAGVCFGALLLTRAAALPPVIAIIVYVIWAWHRRRGLGGAILWLTFVATIALTVVPWQLAMRSRSHRGLLTSVNNMTLYMGNNPWVLLELGSAFPVERKQLVIDSVANSGLTPGQLAMREIASRPGDTLLRALARFRMLISPDTWVVRHAVMVRYPPMPLWGLLLLSIVCFGSFWLMLGLIIRGFCEPNVLQSYRWFLIVVALSLAAGPILTVARSRYHQPILFILLPFAAVGAQYLFRAISRKRAVAGLSSFLVLFLVSISAVPVICRWSLRPSTYYHEVISYLPFTSAQEIPFGDLFLVRSASGEADLENLIVATDVDKINTAILPSGQFLGIHIESIHPKAPARLSFARSADDGVIIDPVEARRWGDWHATAIDGIDVAWHGSVAPIIDPY